MSNPGCQTHLISGIMIITETCPLQGSTVQWVGVLKSHWSWGVNLRVFTLLLNCTISHSQRLEPSHRERVFLWSHCVLRRSIANSQSPLGGPPKVEFCSRCQGHQHGCRLSGLLYCKKSSDFGHPGQAPEGRMGVWSVADRTLPWVVFSGRFNRACNNIYIIE